MKTKRYSERERYVCWVMWVIGFSEPSIAQVLGIRRKQVAGLVRRSPVPNRSSLTDEQRQAELDKLLRIRIQEDGTPIDGGLLSNIPTKVMPLRKVQRRGDRVV